jgi:hypothetical protein
MPCASITYMYDTYIQRSRGSSVSTMSDYRLDDWMIGVQSLAEVKDFSLASVSRPALRPTQPPIQWVLCALRFSRHFYGHFSSCYKKNFILYKLLDYVFFKTKSISAIKYFISLNVNTCKYTLNMYATTRSWSASTRPWQVSERTSVTTLTCIRKIRDSYLRQEKSAAKLLVFLFSSSRRIPDYNGPGSA